MRISDWSSDVCSSYLPSEGRRRTYRQRADNRRPNCSTCHLEKPEQRRRDPGPIAKRFEGNCRANWIDEAHARQERSEERREGNESVRTCRSRWSPYCIKKNSKNTQQQAKQNKK